MLQTQSFEISDSAGVNQLLDKFPLAKGMHILVSEGKIMVPFEDGRAYPPHIVITRYKEEQNLLRDQIGVIRHSQKVMEHLIADCEEKEKAAEAAWANNRSNKALEAKFREAKEGTDHAKNQYRMNAYEINRLELNIQKHDEMIAELEATPR